MIFKQLQELSVLGKAITDLSQIENALAPWTELSDRANLLGEAVKELSLAQQIATLSSEGLDEENIRLILSTIGVTNAQIDEAVSNGTVSFSQKTTTATTISLSNAYKGLAASIGLSTAALTAWIAGIAAIGIVAIGIKKYSDSLKEARESLKETGNQAKSTVNQIKSDFESLSSTTDEVKNRYAELAQKVENLGKVNQSRGTLSTEDYEEFLGLSNKLAELFPQLTKGYDDNGNAILNLSGDVNTIVGSLDDLVSVQQKLANQEIIDKMPDIWSGYKVEIEEYNKELTESEKNVENHLKWLDDIANRSSITLYDESTNDLLREAARQAGIMSSEYGNAFYEVNRTASESGTSFNSAIWDFSKLTEEEYNKFLEKVGELGKKYEDAIQMAKGDISAANADMSNYINTWLSTEWNFSKMDSNMQNVVKDALLSTNWIDVLPDDIDSGDWDAVSNWLQREFLYAINNIDNEQIKTALVDAFNGELTVESLQNLIGLLIGTEGFDENNPLILYLQTQLSDREDFETRYNDAIARFAESETQTVNELKSKYQEAIDKRKELYSGENYVGNVDINNRPVVVNDDGTYSTTSTSFQERQLDDGTYEIIHFTPILPDGTVLEGDALNTYIDKLLNSSDVLYADDPANGGYGLVYKVDTEVNGQKITDGNLETAFGVADAWDVEMHNVQDKMYRDEAEFKMALDEFGTDSNVDLEKFFSDNSIDTTEEIDYWNKVTDGAKTAEQAIRMYYEAKSQEPETPFSYVKFGNLESDLSSIIDVYQSFVDGMSEEIKVPVDASELEALRETFGKLDSFNDFVDTLGTTESGSEKAKTAVENLIGEYLRLNLQVGNCTEAQKQYVISQLEAANISNAETIVLQEIAKQNEAVALSEELCIDTGKSLKEVTSEDVKGFLEQATATETARQYLLLLIADEQVFGNNELDVSGKVKALEELAASYGLVGTQALASAYQQSIIDSHGGALTESDLVNLRNKMIEELGKVSPVNVEIRTPKVSGSGKDAYVEAFEKELESLQVLRDRGEITEKEYLDRLKVLYEKYFKDRKKYLDEFKKYETEYLEGMESLYNSAISGIAKLYDKRIDGINKIKDALEEEKDAQLEALETQIEAKQEVIDGIQDEIDKMQEANDERKANIDLMRKEYELEKLQNMRTRLVKLCQTL